MPGSRPPSAASFAASSVSGRHVAELGAHRLDRGEYVALGLFVSGLDRRAEYSAAGVDFPQHHRDVGSQARRPRVLGGKDLLDAPADLLLQVARASPGAAADPARPAAQVSTSARTSAPTEASTPMRATAKALVRSMASARIGPNAAAHSHGRTPRRDITPPGRPLRVVRSTHSRRAACSRST